ncbi:MAG TPA: sigma-70 family RNA polymerase sigma factor, partial [Acidimicrobiia bacterium]|nr:sigma-70 family RNA polymerase sigma factor [Acidimicrobiia bacterium]
MSGGGPEAGPASVPGILVQFTLPPTLTSPFVARRLVGALITVGPRLRAVDASLLAGEVTTLALGAGTPIVVSVIEQGRTVRVSVSLPDRSAPEPDRIVQNLLGRVADRWNRGTDALWFELDLVRRKDLSELSDDDLFALMPDDLDARDELFERYSGFASSISRRFRSRDHRTDDLEQVALVGLVQALERFDRSVGVKFTTFAGQTISGVVKRHLRDHAWTLRVPRSLKEGALEVTRGRAELTQSLGREPTMEELAETLDMSLDNLHEAVLAGDTYSLASLDTPVGTDGDGGESLGALIGDNDPDMELAADWPAVEAVLDRLSDREQQVLYLRFFEDLTQSEIAPLVGVSQVHVSRILT